MENNSTNWTVGTTFAKYFFTDVEKMVILALSIFFDIAIVYCSGGMNLFEIILILVITNVGSVLNIITSIRDWRKEKAKLK